MLSKYIWRVAKLCRLRSYVRDTDKKKKKLDQITGKIKTGEIKMICKSNVELFYHLIFFTELNVPSKAVSHYNYSF